LERVDNQVHGAVFEQKFTALKTFRQGFTYRLFNDAWPGKTDQCFWLGDIDITQHGKTGRDTPHGRIGHN